MPGPSARFGATRRSSTSSPPSSRRSPGALDAALTAAAIAYFAAEMIAPGAIRHTEGNRISLGEPDGERSDRARRIAEVCERWQVPLRAAAIQFPMAHPGATSLVAGVRTVSHLDEYPAFAAVPIPAGMWDELRERRLLRPDAPVPAEVET